MSRVCRGKNCATISSYVHLYFEKYIVQFFYCHETYVKKDNVECYSNLLPITKHKHFQRFFTFVTLKRNVFRYNCWFVTISDFQN